MKTTIMLILLLTFILGCKSKPHHGLDWKPPGMLMQNTSTNTKL